MAAPCVKAIQAASAAGRITARQAGQILRDARRFAANQARLKQISINRALQDIAGELPNIAANDYARLKRNALLNIKRNRAENAQVMGREFTPGAGIEAQLLGSESAAKGVGGGYYGRIAAKVGAWYSRLSNELHAAGQDVISAFHDSAHPLDFFREMEAQSNPALTPGLTGNRVALKLAAAVAKVLDELTATVNANGGSIGFREGWMGTATHDVTRIRRLGRQPGLLGVFRAGDSVRAKAAWKAMEMPLWDQQAMIGQSGKTIDDIADEIFDNLWHDRHNWEKAGELDTSFSAYGSLAGRYGQARVIFYKDAASFLKHESTLGRYGDKYALNIANAVANRAKLLSMMGDMGSAGKMNIKKRVDLMREQLRQQPPSAKRDADIQSLEDVAKFERMYDTVSGAVDIPKDLVLAKVFQTAKIIGTAARGGGMLISSLGDPVFQVNQMAMSGVGKLDALSSSLMFYHRGTKTSAEALHQLGLGSAIYLNGIVRSFGRDIMLGEAARKIQSGIYSIFGMTHHTEAIRAGAATAIAETYGRESSKAFGALSPDIQRTLQQYGISPDAWNAMRGAKHTIVGGPLDGYTVLTHENFHTISDATIDALVVAQGMKATTPNRVRMRNELESNNADLLHDRTAAAASEPGGWEAFARTAGGRAQSGTLWGEMYRPLFMFKSFPMAIARRNAAIWNNRGPYRAVGNYAFLIAGSAVAGYLTMTARELLAGRKRPSLVDHDGSINWGIFMQALDKGGTLGLYGNILLGDYDRYGKDVLSSLSGPMYGQAAQWFGAISGMVPDDERTQAENNSRALKLWKAAEGSIPFQNLFYLKPALDHAIFWNIREMVSPGTLHRSESAIRSSGRDFYIRPSEIAPLPIEERMGEMFKMPVKAVESLSE